MKSGFPLAFRVLQACAAAVFLFVVALPLVGCAQSRPFEDLWVERRPMHAQLDAIRPPAHVLSSSFVPGQPQADVLVDPQGELTLHQALRLSLAHNPDLAAAGWQVVAAQADARQSGRPPNPRASLAVENFAGPQGGDTFERQTLRLSQVIELADKRNRRVDFATSQQRLVAWDYEQARLDTAAQVARRYVDVVVGQQRVELAGHNLALAQRAFDIVNQRVETGVAPVTERNKAQVRLSLQRIAQQRSEREYQAARQSLAALWGGRTANFTQAVGDLSVAVEVPDAKTLRERLRRAPAVARWDDEIASRRAAWELARANAVPDPTLGGGVRYFPDADDTAGVVEFSVPLAILDRNEGGILAARLRIARAYEQRNAAQAAAARDLVVAMMRFEAAAFELQTLDDEAIPAARSAYDSASRAYELGQTDYLEVLDAERTLVEVELQKINASGHYHTAVIDIERLTASQW